MKKFVCAILTASLAVSVLSSNAAAEVTEVQQVTPRWVNVKETECLIETNGSSGDFSLYIEGYSGTTKITANTTLYKINSRGNRSEVSTDWNYSVNSTVLDVVETFSALSGYSYEVEVDAVVTKNGVYENITLSSSSN